MNLYELITFQDNYEKLKFIQNHRRDIVPFIGAGISIDCGLFSWNELLDEIAKDFLTEEEIKLYHERKDWFGYADKIIEVTENPHLIMKRIRELFDKTPIKLTKSPYILLSSFSDLIVTTNYDTILEIAAKQNANSRQLKPLLPCLKGQIDEAIQINAKCLLKLHGSIEETSSFILTTEQYDAFYGKQGCQEKKPLLVYLEKLFSGKKMLFVGCSLDIDRTLMILCDCVKKYQRISHYAIVPWNKDKRKQLMRARQLIKMGIEPIYYPEGDFEAVGKLLSYLAIDNNFLEVSKKVIYDKIVEFDVQSLVSNTLYGMLKQSYYDTASELPDLLDDSFAPTDIELTESIRANLKINVNDTYYSILLKLFNLYVDAGIFHNKKFIKNEFEKIFSKVVLEEKSVMELSKKRWSLKNNLENLSEINNDWILQLSKEEVNDFASDLISKLQYKNGMSFADIRPAYIMAKQLEKNAGDMLEYTTKTRLLNSLGGFSYYFKDLQNGIKYLQKAVQLIESKQSKDSKEFLFLAKCYYNLALVLGYNGNTEDALGAISKDMKLKIEYHESPQLYARTCDLYALICKEIDPFKAGMIYLETAQIKEEFAKKEYMSEQVARDMMASWATVLFNIGLLARDIGLYEIADRFVRLANFLRFPIVDICNKDYCNSLNVQAEINLALNKSYEAEKIVNIIKSKQELPKGFSLVMGHTWYICAYYFYYEKDYSSAVDYINRSLDYLFEDDLLDAMQIIKSKMLLGAIIYKIKINDKGLRYQSSDTIFEGIIEDIIKIYGEFSYYLSFPYRFLMMYSEDEGKKKIYTLKYDAIFKLYNERRESLSKAFVDYLNTL